MIEVKGIPACMADQIGEFINYRGWDYYKKTLKVDLILYKKKIWTVTSFFIRLAAPLAILTLQNRESLK
jgi:hypothetical protein